MQYLVWKDRFTKIAETSGVIQNASKTITLEVSDSQTQDSGILLPPSSQMAFKGEVYVRCVNGTGAEVRVATFATTGCGGGGGSGSSDTPSGEGYDIANDQQIDELLNTIFPLD